MTDDKTPTLDDLRNMSDTQLADYADDIRQLYRRVGSWEVAREEYSKVLTVLRERKRESSDQLLRTMARALYDDHYVCFLTEDIDSAIALLDEHDRICVVAEDRVGFHFGRFRRTHTEQFALRITLEEASDQMRSTLAQLADLYQQGMETRRCDNFMFNIEGRLFELAVEEGDLTEAEKYYAAYLSSSVMEEALSGEKALTSDQASNHYPKLLRIEYVRGNYESALEHASKFLPAFIPALKKPDPGIATSHANRQERARDYYYAGSSLEKLGSLEDARTLWQETLKLPPEFGNYYYQRWAKSALNGDNNRP